MHSCIHYKKSYTLGYRSDILLYTLYSYTLYRCIQEADNRRVSWYNDLIDTLWVLSESGYAPINSNDPVADILIKYNIAGFVPFKAYAPNLVSYRQKQLSSHRRASHSGYGLAPTTQMVRTAIALKLPRVRRVWLAAYPRLRFKLPRVLMV